MSEYRNVEKPFLNSLHGFGWQIIDQGCNTIPQDATISLRSNFREIVLRDEFIKSVRKINLTDDAQEWLTDKQLVQIYDDLLAEPYPNLLAANIAIHELLTKQTIVVDSNELTGEQFVKVKLIDFDNISANSFIAINQFRIDTIGTDKSFIIPDIVLFVNGMPLVVIECKDFDVANPIHEAVTQIRRYSNQREATKLAGLREGEERLFWFNVFSIDTYANIAKYGTITSDEEFYFEWKDVFPRENLPLGVELSNLSSQDKLICGMLAPANLLDILRSFTLFETSKSGITIKKVPRYQQYRAVGKIIQRLATGVTPLERSGVIWHTQGSGKSLTMVMLIRKLRTVEALKAFKVLLVNDRIDLEEQLGETALLTNEKIDYVENNNQLREKLATPSSNIVMVMIHKFQEAQQKVSTRIDKQLENVNLYRVFKEINPSENILVLIDEAHRTQGSEMGDNLFTAFPNATRIAFTGTPLITERHNTKTVERFGSYIDKYKLQDAVDDGATLQIIYEGRSADSAIYDKMLFEEKLNTLLQWYSPEEQAAVRQKYGTSKDMLDAPEHVNNVANDLVNHYIPIFI
jgi:type I restriction enzyme R subunit